MIFLFFDTETTGLPIDWKAPMTDLDNWPRVIQLAWLLTDTHGIELNRGKHLIFPDGWTIPAENFWIDNGFSTAHSTLNGIGISVALDLFIEDLNACDVIISHNMSFDYNVLGAEMIRAGKKGKKVNKICTKEKGTEHCKLPGKYGTYKWPKLTELHHALFNSGFDGAHDALADVVACSNCFFELVRLGVIEPKPVSV